MEGFERLPQAARYVYAIWRFDAEVSNGGFHQLFYNPTGILAPEALEGLRAVGLQASANVAEVAIKKFGEPYPRDHEARYQVLKSLEQPGDEREQWDPFYELDDKYYAAADSEQFDARLNEFALQGT